LVQCASTAVHNATDLLDVEYRVENTIAVTEERLDETYWKRPQIETTTGVYKGLGSGPAGLRPSQHPISRLLGAVLRLAGALTIHE
jgi:hypothetical protein